MEVLFEDVDLQEATFNNARLISTTFKRTNMCNVDLAEARRLDNLTFIHVAWEKNKVNRYERNGDWPKARLVYETLKQAYTRQGDLRTAGDFFYREMECRRRGAETFLQRLGYRVLCLFWGYGERPFRAAGVAALTILLFAITFALINPATSFINHLYVSSVSFTALGYGSWVETPPTAIRSLAIVEAIIGVALNGSFLVTLTRKMSR